MSLIYLRNKLKNDINKKIDFNTLYDEDELKIMGTREQMYFRYRKIQEMHKKPEFQLKLENQKTSVNLSGINIPPLEKSPRLGPKHLEINLSRSRTRPTSSK